MQLSDIQQRLTDHLAGEASTDFHTTEARLSSIREAYEYISETYSLWGDILPTGPKPADYYSVGVEPGTYNKIPPLLTAPTDQPWSGLYPQFHKLISFYAAYRLFQDKGPEMFERANYWLDVYTKQLDIVTRNLIREGDAEFTVGEVTPDTWGGLQRMLRFNLDTSEIAPEAAFRMFPRNVRDGFLRAAYKEITQEHDLSIKTLSITIPNNMTAGTAQTVALPVDFLSPAAMVGYTDKGVEIQGSLWPYGPATGQPSFSIGKNDDGHLLYLQNFKTVNGLLLVNYVAAPPALVNQTDKPWNGMYPTGNKLIVLRAMRDMMRGKKELYQMSRFWQNEYDREVVPFKKMLRRYEQGTANVVHMGYPSDLDITENSFTPLFGGDIK